MADTVSPPLALPRLNEPAPQFEANSTHGPIRLDQFKGKWVVLFSHPADFTPVCSTEFLGFASHAKDFDRLGVQLIGLSIDSVYAHIAWIRTLEDKFKTKIPFPVIADLDMKVANLYGMVHPGAASTATVRAVFVIDPKQNVRAMIYYPLSNGRSIDELLRIVEALQTTDAKAVATPEGWRKGQKVIVPPPTTQSAAEKRLKEGFDAVDWFFCTRPEPEAAATHAASAPPVPAPAPR
jgi:peroxiredoxin (alkyl hydroperoxide reductase subunit C)